jgi:hypothetical protein
MPLVVCESMFGNTEFQSDRCAQGLRGRGSGQNSGRHPRCPGQPRTDDPVRVDDG